MRIYYASQSFYPYIGGVSTYLLNLCTEMINKGNDIFEVHLKASREKKQDTLNGIKILRVPAHTIDRKILEMYFKFKEKLYNYCHFKNSHFMKPLREMDGYKEYLEINEYYGNKIRDLLSYNRNEVVHVHDFQLLLIYKYLPRNVPLIFTFHIPFIDGIPKPISRFMVNHMNEYDKIVFSSPDYIAAAVNAGAIEEKVQLIYPIANTNLFKPLDINKKKVLGKYGIPTDSKIILCVQRIDQKSGHEQLIRALPLILKQVSKAKLVFVGGESLSNKMSKERDSLCQKVKLLVRELRLEKQIIFTGNIEYSNLPEVYNSVDVVTLCSKNEGFGLSVTEGMACGKPIVGTNVSGIALQVKDGENGFLVDVGDVDATADRLIKILKNNRLKEKMASVSLELVKTHFRIEQGVEKHLILYNQTIKKKTNPTKPQSRE